MTRGVLLAWLGAGVAAAAILAALFWPMNASVAPRPAADASVASPSSVPAPPPVGAPVEQAAATTDARGRIVRNPPQRPAGVAPVAPSSVRRDPAPVPLPAPKPLESSTTPSDGGNNGDDGSNGNNNDGNRGGHFGDFFPGG